MSDFIQIGDLIINKAHIIDIQFSGKGAGTILYLTTSGLNSAEEGNNFFTWHSAQATELWEQLQRYLAPTVIQLTAPPPVIYTVGTISDEDSDIF